MLYVQFDSVAQDATRRRPAGDAILAVRIRRLADVLDGLELRRAEPAVLVMRYAVAFALGVDALDGAIWKKRGLDGERGFSLIVGARDAAGRWPVGLAAFAHDARRLTAWLEQADMASRSDGDVLLTGDSKLAPAAAELLRAPWVPSLASQDPYIEVVARLGVGRELGGLWGAACRRDGRFQVEMVTGLPGVSPLHVIARDPPTDTAEIIPPDRTPPQQLRVGPGPAATGPPMPPSWDEPGPCDCGVPPDACAMKRFRLVPAAGAPPSELQGADTLRQLSASLVDLHRVRRSSVAGVREADRVLVARSPESLAAIRVGDAVLDDTGTVRSFAGAREGLVGVVLAPLPWPPLGRPSAFRMTFSGIG